ncbi:MAG: hypothetical protein KGJ55_05795 [Gammaproteobacteria bacterium]|nr:hypothetical protein [Gammaproteobacteria bacterium]
MQPGAGCGGEALDVALRKQVARHVAVLLKGRDYPQGFVTFGFDLRHRAAEHVGIADRAVGDRRV